MKKAIVGKKIGMTQVFTEDGRLVPVTVIEAGPCTVTMVTDSQYVVNAFKQHWISGWIKRGWKTASKQPVKNVDLWKRLLAAAEPHDVRWQWVKGHAGHPENERCDSLATAAADDRKGRTEDAGFID